LKFEFKALNAINQEYVYYLHVWPKKRQKLPGSSNSQDYEVLGYILF
jgi:hypothetical protein